MFSLIALKLDPPKSRQEGGLEICPNGFNKTIYRGMLLDGILALGFILGGHYGNISLDASQGLVATGSVYLVILVAGAIFIKINHTPGHRRYG